MIFSINVTYQILHAIEANMQYSQNFNTLVHVNNVRLSSI